MRVSLNLNSSNQRKIHFGEVDEGPETISDLFNKHRRGWANWCDDGEMSDFAYNLKRQQIDEQEALYRARMLNSNSASHSGLSKSNIKFSSKIKNIISALLGLAKKK